MSKRFLTRFGGAALGVVAAALGAAPAALAQQAADPPAERSADDGTVGEIIVQAQRRSQSLQDVPLSVAAFNEEALVQLGANNIESINGQVPNVVVEHVGLFPAAASLTMRGVGYSGIESFTDPDVAVYINGVYQARNAVALSSTVDVEALEVLRGPQGTLYGRNAYAGVISLRTNRADVDETLANAAVTLGNYGRQNAEFVGNMPLVEGVVGARLAVRTHRLDGYYENNGIIDAAGTVDQALEGQSIGREDTLYVRPSLRFTPDPRLTIDLVGEWYRERSEAYPAIGMPAVAPAATGTNASGVFTACPTVAVFPQATFCYGAGNPFGDSSRGIPSSGTDPFRIGSNLTNRPANYDSLVYVADVQYKMDNGSLRAIVSYSDVEEEVWADTDGTNQNIFSSARWQDYEATTAEVQYVGDLTDRLNVVAGITGLYDKYQTTQLSFTDFAVPFPAVFTPFSAQNPVAAGPSYINNKGERAALAAYAQVEYSLTDPLSVVIGGRYSWEHKWGVRGENSTLTAAGFAPTIDFSSHPFSTVPGIVFGARGMTWENFAPRLGVNYDLNSDLLLYGFWQRAFKSGGYNANSADPVAFRTPYDEQIVDTYEAGIKSEWLDRRLRLNVNAFFTEYSDLQRSAVTPSQLAPSGVTTVVTNAAALESKGVEIEAAMRVTPALTMFANIGYTDAAYNDFCADLDGVSVASTAPAGQSACGTAVRQDNAPLGPTAGPEDRFLVPVDNSGLKVLRAPEWDITGGGSYVVDLTGGGALTFNTSVNYRSETWTQLLNVPFSYREPITTWDGNVMWEPGNGHFAVTVWGRNLTDEIELLNYVPVAGQFAFAHATQPRTYGVTVKTNW